MNPQIYGYPIFDQEDRNAHWKKRQHFQQILLIKLVVAHRRIRTEQYLLPEQNSVPHG